MQVSDAAAANTSASRQYRCPTEPGSSPPGIAPTSTCWFAMASQVTDRQRFVCGPMGTSRPGLSAVAGSFAHDIRLIARALRPPPPDLVGAPEAMTCWMPPSRHGAIRAATRGAKVLT